MFSRQSVAIAALSLSGFLAGCYNDNERKAESRSVPVEVKGTGEAQQVCVAKIGDKKLSLIQKDGASYLMAAGYDCVSVQDFPHPFSINNPPQCSFTRLIKIEDKEIYCVTIGDSKWTLAQGYDTVDLKPMK